MAQPDYITARQRAREAAQQAPTLAQILGLPWVGDQLDRGLAYMGGTGAAYDAANPATTEELIAGALGAPTPSVPTDWNVAGQIAGGGMPLDSANLIAEQMLGPITPQQPAGLAAMQERDKIVQDFNSFLTDGLGGGGGPQRQVTTINGAPMPMPSSFGGMAMPNMPEFVPGPGGPDFSRSDAAMEAARPKAPQTDPEDRTWGMLQGLAAAAAGVGPDTPIGNMLLQLGAGALAGVAQARNANKDEQRRAEERRLDYEFRAAGYEADKAMALAKAQADEEERRYRYAIQKMDVEMRVNAANADASARMASAENERWKMAQPQFQFDSKGNMIISQFEPQTGQWTITREPASAMQTALDQTRTAGETGAGFGTTAASIADANLSPQGRLSVMLTYFDDQGRLTEILGPAYPKFSEMMAQKTAESGALNYTGNGRNEKLDNLRLSALRELIADPEFGPIMMQNLMKATGYNGRSE